MMVTTIMIATVVPNVHDKVLSTVVEKLGHWNAFWRMHWEHSGHHSLIIIPTSANIITDLKYESYSWTNSVLYWRQCLRNNNLRSCAHQFWESPHQIKIGLLQGTNWAIQFQMPLKNLMRNWKFKHKVSFTLKYLKISHTKCIPKVFIITVA